MRDTMCHIHFPDSNRIHDMEKNNQVPEILIHESWDGKPVSVIKNSGNLTF